MSAESGNILVWNRLTEQVLFKEEQPGVKQIILLDNGQRFVAISKPEPAGEVTRVNACIVTRTIPGKFTSWSRIQFFSFDPINCFLCYIYMMSHMNITCIHADGSRIYASEFPVRSIAGTLFKLGVVTCDGMNIVVIGADKGTRDAMFVFNARTGSLVNKIPLKQSTAKVN